MKIILTLSILFMSCLASAQTLQARIDTKGQVIKGLCNQDEYFHLMNGMGNQSEAICPISMEELYNRLLQLNILKEDLKYKEETTVSVDVNCNGEVVNVEVKFKNEALNAQIKDIFLTMGQYTPGEMENKKVDCSIMYFIKIKKGTLTLNGNRWKK